MDILLLFEHIRREPPIFHRTMNRKYHTRIFVGRPPKSSRLPLYLHTTTANLGTFSLFRAVSPANNAAFRQVTLSRSVFLWMARARSGGGNATSFSHEARVWSGNRVQLLHSVGVSAVGVSCSEDIAARFMNADDFKKLAG
jgi:hypothetical protein